MSLADRYNEGKPDLTYNLTAPAAMEGLARVFMYGAKKYARDNWKKGLTYLTCIASLMRHLLKFMAGEDKDEESGEYHVDHIQWNAVILSEMFHTRKDMDDRTQNKEEIPF